MKWMISSVCCAIGGLLLLNSPTVDVPRHDILAECYQADRSAKAALLRQMAGMDFPGEGSAKHEAAGDHWNEHSTAARIEAFIPFTDAVSEAIWNGTLDDLATQLEAGQ